MRRVADAEYRIKALESHVTIPLSHLSFDFQVFVVICMN